MSEFITQRQHVKSLSCSVTPIGRTAGAVLALRSRNRRSVQTRGELSNARTRLTIWSEGVRGAGETALRNKVYINRARLGCGCMGARGGRHFCRDPRARPFVHTMFLLRITKVLHSCNRHVVYLQTSHAVYLIFRYIELMFTLQCRNFSFRYRSRCILSYDIHAR